MPYSSSSIPVLEGSSGQAELAVLVSCCQDVEQRVISPIKLLLRQDAISMRAVDPPLLHGLDVLTEEPSRLGLMFIEAA